MNNLSWVFVFYIFNKSSVYQRVTHFINTVVSLNLKASFKYMYLDLIL